jgi:RNA polymerase sigma factor (sigma-70 family)
MATQHAFTDTGLQPALTQPSAATGMAKPKAPLTTPTLAAVTAKPSDKPEAFVQKKGLPKNHIENYKNLIETVARVEYSRLPNHLIDHGELVTIGSIALHVLFTNHPDRDFNVTYLSTAIKWAIRNELRYRYKWYSLRKDDEMSGDEDAGGGSDADLESGAVDAGKIREAVYETILSVDSMMEAENPHEIRDEAYTPDERSELNEAGKLIRTAIAKLPEREKQIIEARFYKNMKMREIGETFNISPSRTSRVVQSALNKLKRELIKLGYNEQNY